MSKRKGVVLIIDDEEEIRESIEMLLNSEGSDHRQRRERRRRSEEDRRQLLSTSCLLDLMLPGKSGMEVQKDIKRIDPTLPVVIITAIGALETAVTAIKEGSFDYITKPWNNEKLRRHREQCDQTAPVDERKPSTAARPEGTLWLQQHHRQE